MDFKNNFKRLREENNLTQEDIANEIGISRQSVSKWENGVNEPDLETIEKLCVIFHCSVDDLVIGKTIVEEANNKTKLKKTRYVCQLTSF